MKKINTLPLALAIVTILLFGSSATVPAVHAQATCLDAAGAPIPCPPTEAPTEPPTGGGSDDNNTDNGGNNTSTPQPITNPTEDPGTDKAVWTGTCKISDTQCNIQLSNSCTNSGGSWTHEVNEDKTEVTITCTIPVILPTPDPGSQITSPEFPEPKDGYLGSCTSESLDACREAFKCEDGLLVIEVDLYADGGTKYDFYCIPHEEVPLLELPFAIPTPGGADENWDGFCITRPGLTLEDCSNIFKAACDADGGDYQEEIGEDGDTLFGRCENQSEAVPPAPTEAPAIAAAPEGDGSDEGKGQECSWGGCWFDRAMCVVSGGFYDETTDNKGVTTFTCTHYNEDGTPVEGGAPAPNWGPWVVIGIVIILAVILLPAVQKFANKPTDPQPIGFDALLTLDGVPGESKDKMPNNKNPELVKNKDDGGEQGKSSVHRLFGDADGDTPPPPPPPPPAKK